MGVRIWKDVKAVIVVQFTRLLRHKFQGEDKQRSVLRFPSQTGIVFVTIQPSIKWVPSTNLSERDNSPLTSTNAVGTECAEPNFQPQYAFTTWSSRSG
jgi:hypothetical protein